MSTLFPIFIVNADRILLLEVFLTLLGVFPQEGMGIGLVLFLLNYHKTCGGQVPLGPLLRPVF